MHVRMEGDAERLPKESYGEEGNKKDGSTGPEELMGRIRLFRGRDSVLMETSYGSMV
jgi:hypothetical protein